MTKISKKTKLKALIEYFDGNTSLDAVAKKYQINRMAMHMLVAAYRTHGTDVVLNPPKVTPEFRVKVARWAEETGASYTEVAAKFGYLGIRQIQIWREIYRQKGPNGLLSITKGRKPRMNKMNNKKRLKRKNDRKRLSQETDQQRIKELEDENLELRIKLEASKLLASMKQRTNKSHN